MFFLFLEAPLIQDSHASIPRPSAGGKSMRQESLNIHKGVFSDGKEDKL
jgi:hypothetical protein